MSRRRDERGAAAIIFAVVVVLLFSMAALAVDLGQAYVRKGEVQRGADMSALAGSFGDDLPAPAVSGTCSYGNKAGASDQAILDVAAYLIKNDVWTGLSANQSTVASQLVDCNVTNGEAFYGKPNLTAGAWHLVYNKNQLSLVSPRKRVDFGMAQLMGFHDVNVVGKSTVEIKSPKMATLPFYAFTGCDYGPQTLQQPNNGHSIATLQLANGSDTNAAVLNSVTPTYYPAGTPTGTLQPIDIAGTGLTGVVQVGFFEPGNGGPGPAPVIATPTSVTSTNIHLNDLPDQTRGVTGVQSFWYIRVRFSTTGPWSSVLRGPNNNQVLNAPQLTIGDPPLTCGQGSSAGNFGTILLSHSPYTGADKIGAANVALGLTSTLSIYPVASRLANGTCSTAQPATILWTAAGTNCVDTDTGMSSNVATGGLLGTGSSAPASCSWTGSCGLLAKPFTTKCGAGNTAATAVVGGVTINNDVLSCFFTNTTVKVGDIDTASYSGPPVLSSDIYNSPRFGYVPVLPIQPTSGGSNKYQIIDFRPCFITNQTASAQKGDVATGTNGLTMSGSAVQSVQVIFINGKALPVPPVKNGTINYMGSGPKIPLLVN